MIQKISTPVESMPESVPESVPESSTLITPRDVILSVPEFN
jgi:hypothetical protein